MAYIDDAIITNKRAFLMAHLDRVLQSFAEVQVDREPSCRRDKLKERLC